MLIHELHNIRKVLDGKEIGIEIEAEGANLTNGRELIKNWKCVHDGSLRGESIEYVLKVPVKRGEVNKNLKELCTELKNNNAVVNDSDRCGVHVHINCQDLTVKQVLNFILLYYVFEDVLVKYCGDSREGNLFCLRTCDAEALLHAVYNCQKLQSFNHMHGDIFRYASCNISALFKYGTLEFRSLKTPKNFMEIEEWVELLLKVKDHSLKIVDSRDIVESFTGTGGGAFLEEVFGKLSKVLKFDDTRFLLHEAVRRIQYICYAKPGIEKKRLDKGPRALVEAMARERQALFGAAPEPVMVQDVPQPMPRGFRAQPPRIRPAVDPNEVIRQHQRDPGEWAVPLADVARAWRPFGGNAQFVGGFQPAGLPQPPVPPDDMEGPNAEEDEAEIRAIEDELEEQLGQMDDEEDGA